MQVVCLTLLFPFSQESPPRASSMVFLVAGGSVYYEKECLCGVYLQWLGRTQGSCALYTLYGICGVMVD